MILGTLVEKPRPHTGLDDLSIDAPFQQVGEHPPVVGGRFRQGEGLALHRLGRGQTHRQLVTELLDRLHKAQPLHLDEVVQGGAASHIPAFPVPQAGGFADLEAVVVLQVELPAGGVLFQLAGPVPPQELDGGDLFGGLDLFFRHAGHTVIPPVLEHGILQGSHLVCPLPGELPPPEVAVGGGF